MSNLRVTDVQAVLRKFAGLGHDVTSDPRAVNLEGRSYGMPVGHFLNFENLHTRAGEHHSLTSYLSQTEKPVISSIRTSHTPNHKTGLDRVRRQVSPLIPTRWGTKREKPKDIFHDYTTYESKGWHGAESLAPSGSLLWTPDKLWADAHPDVHEALEHHKTGEFPYGQVDDPEVGLSDLHPEDRFDFKNAIADMVQPAVPHKGLVTVRHGPGSGGGAYVYNPETEQMFKHGDYGV
jgi:hypothetical protein